MKQGNFIGVKQYKLYSFEKKIVLHEVEDIIFHQSLNCTETPGAV